MFNIMLKSVSYVFLILIIFQYFTCFKTLIYFYPEMDYQLNVKFQSAISILVKFFVKIQAKIKQNEL